MQYSFLVLAAALGLSLSSGAQASDTSGGPAEIISCPAKGKSTRSFDFSTGGLAPWVVNGPDIPNNEARATPIDAAELPTGWNASIAGARWVQGMPSSKIQPHSLGNFVFSVTFQVKKGKRMPRLSLTGQVIADEMFELNLLEQSAQTSIFRLASAWAMIARGRLSKAMCRTLIFQKAVTLKANISASVQASMSFRLWRRTTKARQTK